MTKGAYPLIQKVEKVVFQKYMTRNLLETEKRASI